MREGILLLLLSLTVGCGRLPVELLSNNNVETTNNNTATSACTGAYSNDLAARFDFSEQFGLSTYDSSPNALTGTLFGSTWVNGRIGTALSFNGSSSYVHVPHDPVLNINYITIEAWVKGAYSDSKILVQKYNNSTNGFQLYTNNGHLSFAVNSGSSVINSESLLPIDTWYHLAATYDGQKAKLYMNGALDYEVDWAAGTIVPNSEALVIGQRVNQYYFSGIIDQLKIYSRALTAHQIDINYRACE